MDGLDPFPHLHPSSAQSGATAFRKGSPTELAVAAPLLVWNRAPWSLPSFGNAAGCSPQDLGEVQRIREAVEHDRLATVDIDE